MTIKYVNVRGGAGVAAANHATRPQDDLYLAVNGDWLATTEIPADQSMTGGVMDLFFNVEDQLLADFAKFRQQPATVQDSILREAVKLDQLALDFEKREADGIRPAQIRLAILDQLHHWDDVNDQLAELIKMGAPLPFDLFTEPDMKNTTRKLLTFGVPNLILPGKKTTRLKIKRGQQLLATWHQMAVDVLKRFGFEETVATQLVDQAVAFDASLVPFVKGTEELADYTARYHPTDFAEFTRLIPAIDLNQAIADILQRLPVQINVTQPEYFKHLNQLLTTTPFEEFKAWLQVKLILETTAYLTEDLRQLGDRYRGVLGGRRATPSQEKQAYRMVVRYFDDVIGKYYGETYFGDQAR